MINKNILVYGAILFSCAPFMMAHAKHGDNIPFQIKANVEAETCSVVTEGMDNLTFTLPDMPINEVEELYSKKTTKKHTINETVTITCAAGKRATFTYTNNNRCDALINSNGDDVGCLDNKSLGFVTSMHYIRDSDNKLVLGKPSSYVRNLKLENKMGTFKFVEILAYPIKGQKPSPGIVGADMTLRIWAE